MPSRSASDSSSRLKVSVSSWPPRSPSGAPRAAQPEQRGADADAQLRGGVLAHALARVFEQRVRDLVAHDRRHLVVVELQLAQDAVVERDLAARHAKRVELLRAEQVDLPLPVLGVRVALAVYGMMRCAIARSRTTCGWSFGPSACLLDACCSICRYCWFAACSTCCADTILVKLLLLHSGIVCANAVTGSAAAAISAAPKRRLACR